MDYIKIRFGNSFEDSDSKFEQTIEDVFQSLSPMFKLSERSWKPPIDIYEADQEVIIIAEVAGVDKEDLDLEINPKAVKISGRRSGPPPIQNTRYRLAEIQYGPFERILFLPATINTDKVTATYANGLLKINMAKSSCKETIRSIPIEDG